MTLKEEKEKFVLIAKRILKDDLTDNADTLARYKADIIKAYNTGIDYVTKNYNKVSKDSQERYVKFAEYIRTKFLLCLENLKLRYEFGDEVLN